MIEVTRLNGTTVLINSDLIETVEETPDTVISLTTGKKFIVKESRQEVQKFSKIIQKGYFYKWPFKRRISPTDGIL